MGSPSFQFIILSATVYTGAVGRGGGRGQEFMLLSWGGTRSISEGDADAFFFSATAGELVEIAGDTITSDDDVDGAAAR